MSQGQVWKKDFEEEDEFQETPVISCEVMPLKLCQKLLLEVRLYSVVISTLILLHLVCQHKDVCLIFADYLCIYMHTHMRLSLRLTLRFPADVYLPDIRYIFFPRPLGKIRSTFDRSNVQICSYLQIK